MPDSCPTWDLTDLYADIGDASIKADIEACRSSANGLAANWQGRLETAERLLRRAVEAEDATPEFWNNLGVVLVEKGEYAEAEQMLRRAYALDSGESDAIRDNLRLALAKSANSVYGEDAIQANQKYKVVRRGGGSYLLRTIP